MAEAGRTGARARGGAGGTGPAGGRPGGCPLPGRGRGEVRGVRSLDRWLEKDIALKVLAVVLAAVLWLRVGSGQSPAVTVTVPGVPVQPAGLGEGLALAGLEPERVDVSVRAPRSVLDRLDASALRVEVDLAAAGAGQFSLPVTVKAPRGVQVVEVSSPVARVTVDYLAERRIPVQVQVVGVVGEDYRVESPLPSPAEVLVSGPRGRVARVRYAVGSVDVTGATADFSRAVDLRPVDGQGAEVAGVQLKPATVEVRFSLVKLPPAKEVPVEADLQGRPPLGFTVREVVVSPSLVKVRAPREQLDRVASVKTRPVSVEGLTADAEREVAVALPEGVVMCEPATVLVYLRVVEDVAQREYAEVAVQIRNLPEGLSGSCEPDRVKVVVRARRDVLEKVSPQVWVDGSGEAGQREVPVAVEVPAGAEVVSVEPARVVLTTRGE